MKPLITKDNSFEISLIESSDDTTGTISGPFPVWNVQYMGDGQQDFFDTPSEVIDWILDFYRITETDETVITRKRKDLERQINKWRFSDGNHFETHRTG